VEAAGGGMLFPDEGVPSLVEYALGLTGHPEPRLCVLDTARAASRSTVRGCTAGWRARPPG
jgi:hypothetical protein